MAFIKEIRNKGREDFRLDRTQTIAQISISENNRGQRFLSIRTNGSEQRENPDQSSQKIQFGPETIQELKKILADI